MVSERYRHRNAVNSRHRSVALETSPAGCCTGPVTEPGPDDASVPVAAHDDGDYDRHGHDGSESYHHDAASLRSQPGTSMPARRARDAPSG
jgi:hypothetical protein